MKVFELFVVCVAAGLLMAGLVLITVVWTVAVKLTHPHWSWRRCAKYTTLIT